MLAPLPVMTPTPKKTSQATRLQHLRQHFGLTTREVADVIGRSASQISRYETVPDANLRDVLDKLARLYKTTPDFILYGEAGPPPDVQETRRQVGAPALAADNGVRAVPFLPLRSRAAFAASVRRGAAAYEYAETYPVSDLPDTQEYNEAMVLEINGDGLGLRSGSRIVSTPVPREQWPHMAPGVYGVVYADTFVVKQVRSNTLLENGLLDLHSEAPGGSSFPVRGEDIRAVWRGQFVAYMPL